MSDFDTIDQEIQRLQGVSDNLGGSNNVHAAQEIRSNALAILTLIQGRRDMAPLWNDDGLQKSYIVDSGEPAPSDYKLPGAQGSGTAADMLSSLKDHKVA